MIDPDLWWHLEVGRWILANQAVPHAELYSANHISEHWVAYSWLYEVILYALYDVFGLFGHIIFAVVMVLLITRALYSLVLTLSNHVVLSVVLAASGIAAMSSMFYGRSMMFTVFFMLLELHILYRVISYKNYQLIFALPIIFLIWASVHIQFIYGLFVYGCFFLQMMFDYFRNSQENQKYEAQNMLYRMFGIGIACFIATLLTPYHIYIYLPLIQYINQYDTIYTLLQELQSPDFHDLNNIFMLFIAFAGVFAVAQGYLYRNKPFLVFLFFVALVIGFRSARDAWFIVIAATPIISLVYSQPAAQEKYQGNIFFILIGILFAILLASWMSGITQAELSARVEKNFPAKAVDFVISKNYSGHLYNNYGWGGYLIWRFPNQRVSIDGRSYVHSSDYLRHSVEIWNARNWKDDPELAAAGIVLAPSKAPLTIALACDLRFKLVYHDDIAWVFIASAQASIY
jgi:hypothetical protein